MHPHLTIAQAGAFIGGYELVHPIGKGGMAEVWLARRRGSLASRHAAIKLIADHYVGNPAYRRMFRAESELSGLLTHANIVQVFDEGEEHGRSYLVMEWVDGVDLGKIRPALSVLDDDELRYRVSAYVVGQLLHALSYAHNVTTAEGTPLCIVHRDVSPQNVLVSNQGEVKLTDFGVAHHVLEESSGLHVKGKLRYMSPEQLAGKTRAPTVDLYAVGAILHELLDGRVFRDGVKDQAEMFGVVLRGEIPEPSRLVPPELEALRRGLLEPDPKQRLASADMALELLNEYPGYRDARRELMQICRALTGVERPRAGTGDSTTSPPPAPAVDAAPIPGAPALQQPEDRGRSSTPRPASGDDAPPIEHPPARVSAPDLANLPANPPQVSGSTAPFESRQPGPGPGLRERTHRLTEPSPVSPAALARTSATSSSSTSSNDEISSSSGISSASSASQSEITEIAGQGSTVTAISGSVDHPPPVVRRRRSTASWGLTLVALALLAFGGATAALWWLESSESDEVRTATAPTRQDLGPKAPMKTVTEPVTSREGSRNTPSSGTDRLAPGPVNAIGTDATIDSAVPEPSPVADDTKTMSSSDDTGGAPAASAETGETPDSPTPTSAKSKQPPRHTTDACQQAREQASRAQSERKWGTVERTTKVRGCWARSDREQWRKLRVKALAELRRFEECASVGKDAKDPSVRRQAEICRGMVRE